MSEPMTPPETVAPPKPAVPPKPAPPPKAPPRGPSRRGALAAMFGSWFGLAWVSMTAALGGMVLGTVRFLYPNVLSEPPSKFKVGRPEEYEKGKVVERFKDQGTWIVRDADERGQDTIYALSTTCTHLGCTPNWLDAGKFKCPCHGSGFKISGVNFEGPAPRPLERWGISLGEDGQLVVDKSKKFQKELGQWENPESYYKV
jgi:cytochrome b6-f complex iron-sulfur subunit